MKPFFSATLPLYVVAFASVAIAIRVCLQDPRDDLRHAVPVFVMNTPNVDILSTVDVNLESSSIALPIQFQR